MTSTQALRFERLDRGEEAARAALYRLLANLFYAAPTQELLDAIGAEGSGEAGAGALQQAWDELAAACRQTPAAALRQRYDDLFIGVGKPEIMLYGSWYLSGFLMEKPLVQLRADLAGLGLERSDAVPESEDHIAFLCEVMHNLIAGPEDLPASLEVQQRFFGAHIQPWAGELCAALIAHPQAGFYSHVGRLAQEFFAIEGQAFDMG